MLLVFLDNKLIQPHNLVPCGCNDYISSAGALWKFTLLNKVTKALMFSLVKFLYLVYYATVNSNETPPLHFDSYEKSQYLTLVWETARNC